MMTSQAGGVAGRRGQGRRTAGIKIDSSKGYMVQMVAHIMLSAIIACILNLFLMANISQFSSYLYATGSENAAVRYFTLSSQISVLLYVLLGILIFAVTFLLLQRRTAQNIQTIAMAVEQISAGDLSTQLEIEGEGELAMIAENINKMEADIRKLMEKERESERSKNELITNVAHDLRTPLTSIMGYMDLLIKNESLDPALRKKYLDIVYSKSRRLEKLIEDLFGFTKLTYGKMSMKVGEVDIVKLLSQILEESYPSFEKKGLSYELISNTSSEIITADGDLLARVFDNLISNAIKYGADGKRVVVRLTTDHETVTVRVVNYGYIIPEKELPLLFDKFYRVEQSRSVQTGGTGLGLAIVKNIVEMHGGSVGVTSDLSGTVFTVKLKVHFDIEKENFETI